VGCRSETVKHSTLCYFDFHFLCEFNRVDFVKIHRDKKSLFRKWRWFVDVAELEVTGAKFNTIFEEIFGMGEFHVVVNNMWDSDSLFLYEMLVDVIHYWNFWLGYLPSTKVFRDNYINSFIIDILERYFIHISRNQFNCILQFGLLNVLLSKVSNFGIDFYRIYFGCSRFGSKDAEDSRTRSAFKHSSRVPTVACAPAPVMHNIPLLASRTLSDNGRALAGCII